MGAADRFLFPLSQPNGTTLQRLDTAPARHTLQPLTPTTPAVLRRCREPVQLSLFAGLEPAHRTDPGRQTTSAAQTIERRFGARRRTDAPDPDQPPAR